MVEKLLFHLGRSISDGVAAYIGEPAGESAETKSREIGVSARDFHVFHRDAQFFRGDLAHHRVRPLATFPFTAQNQRLTVFIDFDRRRAAVVIAEVTFAADMDGTGETKTRVRFLARALLFPVDHGFRHVETLL